MKKRGRPATDAARRIPRRRRILYSLIPLLVLVTVCESVAWIVDARTHFRARLLDRLALMKVENQPSGSDFELPWQPRALRVRYPKERQVPGVPHVVGGRVIMESWRPPETFFLQPERAVREGQRRVFIVGGSAAFGFPYAYEDTFAGQLGPRLHADGYRVVNAAQPGFSSGRLVPVVRRIVEQFEPDAIVILAGNNEWFQWRPDRQDPHGAARVRLMEVFARSRALAAVEFWLLGSAPTSRDPADGEATGFQQHRRIAGSSHALDHPLDAAGFDTLQWLSSRDRFLRMFERNLTEMVRLARERNVRVVLLTVPFNHRLSPTWKHPQPWWFDAEQREALVAAHREAGKLVAEGSFDLALARIEPALALDPRPPVLHYLKGQSLEGLGEPLAAEEAYAQCRENMIGNLGASLSINRSIAAVAEANDVTLIDVARLFDEYSRRHERWFNADLVHDDCHPTPEGHRLIADALERAF